MVTRTKDQILSVLSETLSLGDQIEKFDFETPLRRALPELELMAAVKLTLALQNHFNITMKSTAPLLHH